MFVPVGDQSSCTTGTCMLYRVCLLGSFMKSHVTSFGSETTANVRLEAVWRLSSIKVINGSLLCALLRSILHVEHLARHIQPRKGYSTTVANMNVTAHAVGLECGDTVLGPFSPHSCSFFVLGAGLRYNRKLRRRELSHHSSR